MKLACASGHAAKNASSNTGEVGAQCTEPHSSSHYFLPLTIEYQFFNPPASCPFAGAISTCPKSVGSDCWNRSITGLSSSCSSSLHCGPQIMRGVSITSVILSTRINSSGDRLRTARPPGVSNADNAVFVPECPPPASARNVRADARPSPGLPPGRSSETCGRMQCAMRGTNTFEHRPSVRGRASGRERGHRTSVVSGMKGTGQSEVVWSVATWCGR